MLLLFVGVTEKAQPVQNTRLCEACGCHRDTGAAQERRSHATLASGGAIQSVMVMLIKVPIP